MGRGLPLNYPLRSGLPNALVALVALLQQQEEQQQLQVTSRFEP